MHKNNQEIIKYLAVVINVGTNSLIALSHFSVLYCFPHSFLSPFFVSCFQVFAELFQFCSEFVLIVVVVVVVMLLLLPVYPYLF